jgi:hypothetical protein
MFHDDSAAVARFLEDASWAPSETNR